MDSVDGSFLHAILLSQFMMCLHVGSKRILALTAIVKSNAMEDLVWARTLVKRLNSSIWQQIKDRQKHKLISASFDIKHSFTLIVDKTKGFGHLPETND